MIYVLIFPAVAFLLALIIGVIIVLLKWGPQICGVLENLSKLEFRFEELFFLSLFFLFIFFLMFFFLFL